MAESMPESGALVSDRRRFLKKAGIAAGAAWVAPAVLSGAAGAQGGSGPARIRVPWPPPPPPPPNPPEGPLCGGTGGIALVVATINPGDPTEWNVQLQVQDVPIELIALQLQGFGPGTPPVVVPPPGPGVLIPPGGFIGIASPPGGPEYQVDSFFDVFYSCVGP
jgi:hypothetical protein